MRHCPVGAIVTVDELRGIAGAAELAAEDVHCTIESETPVNPRFRTDGDRRQLAAWRESERDYRRLADKAARVLAMHDPKKGGRR